MLTLTGVADKTGSGQAIPADRLVVDPRWNLRTLIGDTLLIHLKAPSSRPAMKLSVPGGQYATKAGVPNAAGWGTIDEKSEIGTDILREAYLALQDDATCAAFAAGFDPATQTCAGTPVLWGLTSYGPQLDLGMLPCALKAPAVFSWVPGFHAFIAKHIGTGPKPQPSPRPVPPPIIDPPRDTTAPVIGSARITPRKVRVARRGATISRKAGASLAFRLSEAAAVTVTVLKQQGRSYRALSPSVPLVASAGDTTRRFSGRLGGRALKRGRYKLRIGAVDAAGNAARPAAVSFKIVR